MATNSAGPIGQYHVQTTAKELKSGFPYFKHHDSVAALWSEKWRMPCSHAIYPFTDADVSDFDPIFEELAAASEGGSAILYRPDDYASFFMPTGRKLIEQAGVAERDGDVDTARGLYLRAAAVYRIARFPIVRSPIGAEAWALGKAAYEKGGLLLDPPSVTVDVPFTKMDVIAGDADLPIPAYLRMPGGSRPESGWPVLLFICGLDAYRTDHTPRTQEHVDRGFATLSFEIPGTGDCPAAPNDPTSPDRLMDSIIDWVVANAAELGFDVNRIVARGISTGGYYAFRIAHTHADRLFAVVAQGGGSHHMFDAAWIGAQDQMEYPFALAEALAFKFGYRGADPVASYAADGRKFSLVDDGTLDRPSCRLLVVDGMEDSIFPIEDNFIVATRGDKKDFLARGDRGHMGNPGAEDILYAWIDNVVAAS